MPLPGASIRWPRLRTPRLVLEPWTPEQLAAAHALWVQPGVRRYLWDDEVITRARALGPLQASARDFTEAGFGLWGCYLPSQAEPLGFCGLRRADLTPEPELLFALADGWQGRGLAREAAGAVLRFGFETLGLECIGAATDPPNTRSQRLLGILGFALLRRSEHQGAPTLFYRLAAAAWRSRARPATPAKVALLGDYRPAVLAHRAIPEALALAAAALDRPLEAEWIPTDAPGPPDGFGEYAGVWCVPGSPYRSTDGALRAIRYARETALPFLGTCGGFQHALLEAARNVLGWADAEHAETAPGAARPVIAPLACSLVETSGAVRFAAGSRLAAAYGSPRATESYHCRYGLNPAVAGELLGGPLQPVAWDDAGEVRAVELAGHPFFVATLFQPERAALRGEVSPVVRAFVAALPEAPARVDSVVTNPGEAG